MTQQDKPQADQVKSSAQPPSSPAPLSGPCWSTIAKVIAIVAVALFSGVVLAPRITPASKYELDITKHQIRRLKNNGMIDAATFQQIKQALDAAQKDLIVKSQYYTCGMHPWVILPKPGKDPICGMDLVPLDPAKFSGKVTIDPVVVQNIGVRIAEVKSGPLTRRIRTVGAVDYDERSVRDINIKVPGWIEKLYVDYLGIEVKKGDVLFDFYSPDLYDSQEQYLVAKKNIGIGVDFVPEAARSARELLESSRTRLLYFDITAEQIAELEKRGKPSKTLAILSPHEGVVIAKHANEGMKVDQGMRVYRIADLSKVWVRVTLYEYQLPFIQLGQQAVMTLSYIPGQKFEGKVIYIYPYLDKKTREVQVRLEFDNPHLLLKPGMFANVELQSTLAGNRTLAPRAAVIDTGERKVAFVSLGEGKFEPRDVEIGVEAGDGRIEILDGLKPGEMVVVSGQFLIDSEAKVRETLSKMIRGNPAADQKTTAVTAGATELTAMPQAMAKLLSGILDDYFAIGDALLGDSVQAVAPYARRIAKRVDQLRAVEITQSPHFWYKHEEVGTIGYKALELAQTDKIDQVKEQFADLSVALGKLIKATGVPPTYGKQVQKFYCPMFLSGQGGSTWLQLAGDVRNPFLGLQMLTCFDDRTTLLVTGEPAQQEKADVPRKPEKESPAPFGADDITLGVQQEIDRLIKGYLAIGAMLVRDEFDPMTSPLRLMHESATALGKEGKPLGDLAAPIVQRVDGSYENIDEFRIAFKALSQEVIALVELAPPSASVASQLNKAYCPMSKGTWLQTAQNVANPYYGQSMATCGTIVGRIETRD